MYRESHKEEALSCKLCLAKLRNEDVIVRGVYTGDKLDTAGLELRRPRLDDWGHVGVTSVSDAL